MAFNWHRGREGPSPERESPAPPPQQHDYRTATPAAYTTSQGSQPHSPSSRGGSPFVGAPQARGGEGPPSWERRYGGLPRYSQQQQQQQYMQQMLLLEQPQQQQQVGVGAEIEALQQQCRDSLRSSLRIVGETNQTSQLTAEQLAAQSEQLSRIAQTTEEIGQNLEVSKFLLKGLKGFWGSLTLMLSRPPSTTQVTRNQQQQQQQGRARDAGAAVTSSNARISPQQQQQEQQQQQALMMRERGGAGGGGEGAEVFEEELERDLGKLSTMLGELHGRAAEMHRELEQQNEVLAQINGSVTRNRDSMEQQRRDINRLLKR